MSALMWTAIGLMWLVLLGVAVRFGRASRARLDHDHRPGVACPRCAAATEWVG